MPIIDAGIEDNVPYLITEYAPNSSLNDRLKRQPLSILPIEEALTILSQIGQALHYAHQHNIVHRDLKPDNILFNAKNEALLADFGIAQVLDAARTRSVDMVGTPAYMAPEQFEGKVSSKSDQYALACIAYELLTGRRPFTISPDVDNPSLAWMHQHISTPPTPLTKYNPSLPVHIERVILKAMAKHRDDRHVDVATFLAALAAAPVQPLVLGNPPQPAEPIALPSYTSTTSQISIPNASQKTREQWLEEGDSCFTGGRYREALAAYEQVVRSDPNFADAYYRMGKAFEQTDQREKAFAAYERAILLSPKFAQAYIGKGDMRLAFRRYEEALADYQNAVRLAPELVLGYYGISQVLTALNKHEEALKAYDAAISVAPNSIDSYTRKVTLLERMGGVERMGDRALFGMMMGGNDKQKERYYQDEAIATYEQMILLHPDSIDSYTRKAALLEHQQRYGEAIATYEQIMFLHPDSIDAYARKATLLEQQKRYEEAIAAYEQFILLHPDSIDAYTRKAALLERWPDHESEAIATYEQMIQLDPNSVNAYHGKAALFARMGNNSSWAVYSRNEAIATYKQIIHRFSGSSYWVSKARKQIRMVRVARIKAWFARIKAKFT